MRRAGSISVTLFGIALLVLLSSATAAEAQTGTRVTFGINPTIFRAGQPASAELSVFSVSSSPTTLYAGTNFMFFMDASLGTVSAFTSPIAVESSSLLAGDFSVSFAGGQNPVIVTYNGVPKTFAYGDSFSVKVSLMASAQAGPGKLSFSCPLVSTVNGALPFTTASIVDFANSGTSAVSHDQTLMGDGSAATPLGIAPGGVTGVDLASGAVTASKIASGQVVKSLNGLFDNVSLAQGTNITLSSSGNTLTIGAPNALTAVAHDSTLTGNGTSGSPLGVAGGAVNPVQVFVGRGGFTDLNGNTGAVVAQVTVPAGSYVINAKTVLGNGDSDDQSATCTLSTGDLGRLRLRGKGSLGLLITWHAVMALLDTATFNAPATITFTCGGVGFAADNSVITATKVGSIQ